MDSLQWLQTWLLEQANGDWEHRYGIKMESLDNPGWRVVIDVAETSLELKTFELIRHDGGNGDWMVCRVDDGQFEAVGDSGKLVDILNAFRLWATDTSRQ